VHAAEETTHAAAESTAKKETKSTISENSRQGRAREAQVQDELRIQHPDASVQREQYLRKSDGTIARETLSGEARRIDHVVIKDGKAVRSVETTSMTASKTEQVAKERAIREAGGTFIRDRTTGKLVDFKDVLTEVIRRQ
jgi:hypothetical protein